MKLFTHKIIRLIVLILMLQLSVGPEAVGQTPPPPPPPPNGGTSNGHGLGGNQGTQSAPAGNGIGIILLFAVLYAGMKYKGHEKNEELI